MWWVIIVLAIAVFTGSRWFLAKTRDDWPPPAYEEVIRPTRVGTSCTTWTPCQVSPTPEERLACCERKPAGCDAWCLQNVPRGGGGVQGIDDGFEDE